MQTQADGKIGQSSASLSGCEWGSNCESRVPQLRHRRRFDPPSLPVLNCPLLIFSANSIPEIVITALSKRFKPSIGRIRCFTLRWSCSTRLFKYWLDRTFTRPGSSRSALSPALPGAKPHRRPT